MLGRTREMTLKRRFILRFSSSCSRKLDCRYARLPARANSSTEPFELPAEKAAVPSPRDEEVLF
jgi:hypothetical protein